MHGNLLEIDQKVMQLIEIVDKSSQGVPLDDLLAQFDLLDEDMETILGLLEDFNYQVCEFQGQKVVMRVKEANKPDYGFSAREFYFVRELERLQQQICLLSLISGEELSFVVHRVLFIEGKISFVGERLDTGGLEIVSIANISVLKEVDQSEYQANYSSNEIDDFLIALRKLSENEVRLVLKTRSDERREISPRYHFVRKPYAISNMEGNKIWAGTVELTDDLFAWLVSISDCIEILDPIEVKRGVLKYCEETLYQEIEKQKASNE